MDMLKKLLGLFGSAGKKEEGEKVLARVSMDKIGQPTSEDLQIAVCVILVHIASSDEEVAKEEAEAICQLLEYNLEIAESDIPQIVEKAILARREKGKLDDFVALLNSSYTMEQRVRVLAMGWKLVLSDSKIEKTEERLLVKLASMLYLSIQQQEAARHYAEEGAV